MGFFKEAKEKAEKLAKNIAKGSLFAGGLVVMAGMGGIVSDAYTMGNIVELQKKHYSQSGTLLSKNELMQKYVSSMSGIDIFASRYADLTREAMEIYGNILSKATGSDERVRVDDSISFHSQEIGAKDALAFASLSDDKANTDIVNNKEEETSLKYKR